MCSADHGSNDADNTPLRRFLSDRDLRILYDAYESEVRRYLTARLQRSPQHPDIDDGVQGTFGLASQYLNNPLDPNNPRKKLSSEELLARFPTEESFRQWLYEKAELVVLWKQRMLDEHVPRIDEQVKKRLTQYFTKCFMKHWLRRPTKEELEDLIQNVMDAAFKDLKNSSVQDFLAKESYWLPWVYTVAHSVWIRFLRREPEGIYIPDDEEAEQALSKAEGKPSDPVYERISRQDEVEHYLSKLPDQYRQVMELHRIQELQTSEIAVQLKRQEGSIRADLSLGRKMLKNYRAVEQRLKERREGQDMQAPYRSKFHETALRLHFLEGASWETIAHHCSPRPKACSVDRAKKFLHKGIEQLLCYWGRQETDKK